MQKYSNSVSELIGNTPMLRLKAFEKETGAKAKIFAKLECFNPAGSAKDRVALEIILDAKEKGLLDEDTVIIEPTSGNTGIGIACLAASMGLKAQIVMPDTMSVERRKLIAAYGAEIVLSDGKEGMPGAIALAEKLNRENKNSIIAGQFTNKANNAAHKKTTGPEIYSALDGDISAFVAGIGTGGTISGVGEYLKEQNKDIKVVGIEPDTSAVLSGKPAGAHGIQGIGAGFVPEILDLSVIDEIMPVSTEESYRYARLIARKEGVLVGISSGAALAGAVALSKRPEYTGKNIVVLLPDTGERYLSTDLF